MIFLLSKEYKKDKLSKFKTIVKQKNNYYGGFYENK